MGSIRVAQTISGLGDARGPLIAGVVLTGAATVLLGPLIPEMTAVWRISPSEAAILFVFQFVASSVAALASSFHLRRSIVSGFAAVGIGLAALSTGQWWLAPGSMTLVGLGLGLCVPALNLLFARRNPDHRGAALSVMNLFWGIGAVSSPLLFMAAQRGLSPARVLLVLAVVSGTIAASLAGLLRRPPTVGADGRSPEGSTVRSLLPLAGMLFLYIGIETSVGGWLITVAERGESSPTVVALAIGSGFWATLLAGRAATPLLLRHLAESTLLSGSLALAGLGLLLLLTAPGEPGIVLGALITGLGLAAIFPLLVSLLVDETAADGSRTTGWVFAFGGLGGAVLPWLSAQLDPGHALSRGGAFIVPGAGLLLLAAARVLMQRRPRRRPLAVVGLATLLLATIADPSSATPSPQQASGSLAPIETAVAEAEHALRDDEAQLAESRYRTALLEGWLLLGSLDMAEGDLEGAARSFETAGEVAFETRRARTSLALVNLRRGEVEDALALLRGILAREPDDVPSRRLLAQALAVSGRPEQALQELREALLADPDDLETAYALAMAHLRAGELAAAEDLLERIAAERPSARTHVLIGRTYRDFRLYERARSELLEALAMDPDVSRAHFYLGTLELLAEGRSRIPQAIAEFRRELQLDPEDPITNLYLGMALVEDRQLEAAIAPLGRATDTDGTRVDALRYLGRAQLALGRHEAAVESFTDALEAIGPTEGDARDRSGIHYQLGVALRRLGAAEEAARHFAEAEELGAQLTEESRRELRDYMSDDIRLEASTDVFLPPAIAALAAAPAAQRGDLRRRAVAALARSYFNLGVLAARSERHADAAELLERAAELDGEFPQVQYALGVAHFNAGQYRRATEPLQRALDRQPVDLTLRRMTALAWLESEFYDRAAELLADDPRRHEDSSLQYAYGLALVRSDRAAEAVPVFDRLLEEGGDSADLHVLLGQAEAQQGDYPAAIDALRHALQLDPEVPDARAALGMIYLTQGELEEARSVLGRELEIRPEDRRARYLLATVLDLDREPEAAMRQLRTLLEAHPRFADGRYLLGKILLAQGSAREAVDHLEAAAGLSPLDANIHYQLGQAYQRLGRAEDAAAAFARFRELKAEEREGVP